MTIGDDFVWVFISIGSGAQDRKLLGRSPDASEWNLTLVAKYLGNKSSPCANAFDEWKFLSFFSFARFDHRFYMLSAQH